LFWEKERNSCRLPKKWGGERKKRKKDVSIGKEKDCFKSPSSNEGGVKKGSRKEKVVVPF